MKRTKATNLMLRAFLVIGMGFAALLSTPEPAASAQMQSCYLCRDVCGTSEENRTQCARACPELPHTEEPICGHWSECGPYPDNEGLWCAPEPM